MLRLFLENWFIFVVLSCCIVAALFYIKKFRKQPAASQEKIIKEMIYSLVLQAEKELGSKTGQAKFALVIKLFYAACPVDLRRFVTEEMIMSWVDGAVERMKDYFKSNPTGANNILKTDGSELK